MSRINKQPSRDIDEEPEVNNVSTQRRSPKRECSTAAASSLMGTIPKRRRIAENDIVAKEWVEIAATDSRQGDEDSEMNNIRRMGVSIVNSVKFEVGVREQMEAETQLIEFKQSLKQVQRDLKRKQMEIAKLRSMKVMNPDQKQQALNACSVDIRALEAELHAAQHNLIALESRLEEQNNSGAVSRRFAGAQIGNEPVVSPRLQHLDQQEAKAALAHEDLWQSAGEANRTSLRTEDRQHRTKAQQSRLSKLETKIDEEASSGSEYSETSESDEYDDHLKHATRRKLKRKKSSKVRRDVFVDDADDEAYARRLSLLYGDEDEVDRTDLWKPSNASAQHRSLQLQLDAIRKLQADVEEVSFGDGFVLPASIYDRLYAYQQTGVRWLWELHKQRAGAIVGDEMGLGKSIQVIGYLIGLQYSPSLRMGPVLLVAPASMLQNWVREFRAWWPEFRVMLLHESGNHECSHEQILSTARMSDESGAIVITTYDSLRRLAQIVLPIRWGIVVTDEGHRLKNPDAAITLVAKQLQTPHRIVLSGTPIQNRLRELWSLFDFVFPGKLGSLPVFEESFCLPITTGSYSHATPEQVETGLRCATMLREMITPHILRRLKRDVLDQLPQKSEQILFCRLSPAQRQAYKRILDSRDVQDVIDGRLKAFKIITVLRKVCNHVDLLTLNGDEDERPIDYGNPKRSGKLKVVEQLLEMWSSEKTERHRVLLFAQTRQMLDILESMLVRLKHSYLRLDGTTPVAARMSIVDSFNDDDSQVFVLLLTTRAGGLGLNLIGANRVLIFDPDWNPSVDSQSQERAWRIGQRRNVAVYRLVSRGTIEERVFQRQIFKQLLTQRVLESSSAAAAASGRRLFSRSDLRQLFSLDDDDNEVDNSDAGEIKFEPSDTSIILQNVATEITRENIVAAVDDESETSGDQRVLRALFDNDDLSSVFCHDDLTNSSGNGGRITRVDSAVTRRATAEAERAMRALRASRQAMLSASINEPTWTGRSGTAGLNHNKRFGQIADWLDQQAASQVSSSSILAGFEQRAAASLPHQPANQDNEASSAMAKRLLGFLRQQPNHAAGSQRVIQHFQLELEHATGVDQLVFRSVLQRLAKFNKGSNEWRLKPEFR